MNRPVEVIPLPSTGVMEENPVDPPEIIEQIDPPDIRAVVDFRENREETARVNRLEGQEEGKLRE